ncbi:MAG: transposase, partial [candidate division WOR-3 bacterium]
MPNFKYFIGIDASLNTLDLCIIDTEENIIKQKRFPQTKEGFNEILTLLQTIGNPQEIAIGIESTGNYHINILNFLKTKTYNITFINPLITKKFLQSNTLRKTKTDKISAKIIALYLLKNPTKIINHTQDDTTKLLARECEILAQEIAKLKTRIKQITFNIFNELAHRYNILTQTILEFLLEVPSTRRAKELTEAEITSIIRKITHRRG